MRSKLPYSEYTVKQLIFPYIRMSYSDRINTLVLFWMSIGRLTYVKSVQNLAESETHVVVD
jgi:hypothetical protein